MYKQLLIQYLESVGVKYTEINERAVRIVYGGDNLRSIPIMILFDKDGDPLVEFKCWEIQSCKGKEHKGMRVCNKLNSQYRWIKFYVDDDSDIIADADASVEASSCGEECLNIVKRMVNIIDEGYIEILRDIVLSE